MALQQHARADHGTWASPPTVGSASYRPHLDGLRTIAVYLVVAFHAGSDRLVGGFIGVDVFFVLSGYLVTQSLEHDLSNRGSIRFGRFYARRIRRLLPPALLTILVTAIVFAPLLSPRELDDARSTMRAAVVWVSNWQLIGQGSDYFGTEIEANPFAHHWSLSVEEQFYLVAPLLLTAAFWLDRRTGGRRIALRGIVAALAVASLGHALALSGGSVDRAYMGTDARAYQLLAGCLLALTPGIVTRVAGSRRGAVGAGIVAVALLPALVLAASSAVDLGPTSRGVVATLVALGLLIALDAAPARPAGRLLSLRPVVYLGRISYGTYLWHWPVTLLLDRSFELSPLSRTLSTAVVASALASLSMHLLELPLLQATVFDRRRGATIAVGLAMSVLVAVVAVPRLLDQGAEARTGSVAAALEGTPNTVDLGQVTEDFAAALTDDCAGADDGCDAGAGALPDWPRVLLIGDSHALTAATMLTGAADDLDLDLTVWGRSACPWIRGISYPDAADCFDAQDQLFEVTLDEVDPDLVVLVHRPILDPADPVDLVDAEAGPVAEDRREGVLIRRVGETLSLLRDRIPRVVVIEPTPASPGGFDPLACLASSEFLEECRYVADAEPTSEELFLRGIAAEDERIWSIDLDRAVCPYLPICDPVVGGEVVKMDADHLTVAFAASLADQLQRLLLDEGVVERP